MASRSLFDQFSQVNGTRDFYDDMKHQYAESCGRHYDTKAITVVSGSTTITDTTTNFERYEVNSYVVIDTGPAAGVYQVVSASGTPTAVVSPSSAGTDTAVAYRRHYYKNLEDDLNYLRYQVDSMIGKDNWYDEPCSDFKSMCYLIPKRPNYVGEIGQYSDRPGTVAYSLSNTNNNGYTSTGCGGEYTDNTSSIGTGQPINYTNSTTMTISITGGFYPADDGYIRVYQDGAIVGELDLATAWTADGCSYELEDTIVYVGTNPPHNSTGVGTNIINLTGRRCMNTCVDSYPSFWPPHQMASVNITLTLSVGYKGQIYVAHTTGGSQNYSDASFWVDTSSQTKSPSVPTITPVTPQTRYLSGVPYYTTNATFTISGTDSSSIFNRGYVTNPLTFSCGEFNDSNKTPSLATIGFITTPDITDTIDIFNGYSTTITVGSSNHRDLNAQARTTVRDVWGSDNSGLSAAGAYRIDNWDDFGNSDTVEPFNTETRRMFGNEDFTDIAIVHGDSNWNSTTNITTISGLVVYDGRLNYPTMNHSSGYLPVGPNYSSASGDFLFYRIFLATASFTQGTLTFGGWTNAKTTVESSNVEIHLRYPNCNDYGNNNTNVWQDLGVSQGIYGGNGCQGGSSSGSNVTFSFGTMPSSAYGNRVIMRIKFKSNSVVDLTQITFSPTL